MALLPILEFPDPRLRTRAAPVQQFDAALKQLIADMLADHVRGPRHRAGRHAGQRAPPAARDGRQHREEPAAGLYQPEHPRARRRRSIARRVACRCRTSSSKSSARRASGCARRMPTACRSSASSTGLAAVCLQHEMDHLAGKLFVDYLSRLKRERIRRKLEKERRERASGAVKPASARGRARHMTHAAHRICRHAGIRGADAACAGGLPAPCWSEYSRSLTGRLAAAAHSRASPVKRAGAGAGSAAVAARRGSKAARQRGSLERWGAGSAGRGRLRPDPAAGDAGTAAAGMHQRACLAAAALARCSTDPARASSPAMPRAESRSCRWRPASTPEPILAQQRVPIAPDENAQQLQQRLAVLGAQLLLATLEQAQSGLLRPKPQPDQGVTYAAKIDKARRADRLAARCRGTSHVRYGPSIHGRLPRHAGTQQQLRIWEARVWQTPGGGPGTGAAVRATRRNPGPGA